MTSTRDQIITGVVCGGALLGYALLIARPQSRALGDVRREAVQLAADIDMRRAVAVSTVELEAELQAAEQRLGAVAEQIPSSMRLAELIAQLSAASDSWRLRGTDLRPVRSYEVGGIVVLPIEVSFECDFASLFGFLREIESLPRLVRVSDLRTQRREEAPGSVACELTLRVFSEAP